MKEKVIDIISRRINHENVWLQEFSQLTCPKLLKEILHFFLFSHFLSLYHLVPYFLWEDCKYGQLLTLKKLDEIFKIALSPHNLAPYYSFLFKWIN